MERITPCSAVYRNDLEQVHEWIEQRIGRPIVPERIFMLTKVGRWAILHRFTDPPRLAWWYRFLGIGRQMARRRPLLIHGWPE